MTARGVGHFETWANLCKFHPGPHEKNNDVIAHGTAQMKLKGLRRTRRPQNVKVKKVKIIKLAINKLWDYAKKVRLEI